MDMGDDTMMMMVPMMAADFLRRDRVVGLQLDFFIYIILSHTTVSRSWAGSSAVAHRSHPSTCRDAACMHATTNT
jgi:hypothetical protein